MKLFEFGVTLTKAWKDANGKPFVRGVASDDGPDAQKDRMSEKALRRMEEQVKKGLPLLETHRDVFGFGKSVDGRVVKSDKGGAVLEVEFELDPAWPQANALFNEIEGGKSDKQMSIGGKINTDNPAAVRFETTKDGPCRVVDDVILDHIATTRAGQAANDRTGFMSAILKSLDSEDAKEDPKKAIAGATVPAEKVESMPVQEKNAVEPVEDISAREDAIRGLSLLQSLGTLLGKGGKTSERTPEGKEKQVGSAVAVAVPPAPVAKAAEKPAEVPVSADGTCPTGYSKSGDMCVLAAPAEVAEAAKPAEKPMTVVTEIKTEKEGAMCDMMADGSCPPGYKKVGDTCVKEEPMAVAEKTRNQIQSAVAKYVGGGSQLQLVTDLQSVLTEKSTVEANETEIFNAAVAELSKLLSGKQLMARIAGMNKNLDEVVATLKGHPSAEPEVAMTEEEKKKKKLADEKKPADENLPPWLQESAAKSMRQDLEKDLTGKFGDALEKTLSDFEKTITASIEKSVDARIEKAVAARLAAVDEALAPLTEAAKDALTKTAELEERMDEIESANGAPTRALDERTDVEEAPVKKSSGGAGVFGGMFSTAIQKAQRRM